MRLHLLPFAFSLLLLIVPDWVFDTQPAFGQFWQELSTGSTASLRGLAVSESPTGVSIWAAGAKGNVLRTSDLGKSWTLCGPAEFPELEFRSIHAWSSQEAVIASAGSPAIILRTADGGRTWQAVHRDSNPAAFFDGLRFHDGTRGIVFGDPLDGKFVVLRSSDGGRRWQGIDPDRLPSILPGEAGFAASNSAMLVNARGSIWIGTGGTMGLVSRVHYSEDFGDTWHVTDCPLPGDATSGVFSLAATVEGRLMVAVGGDYRAEATSTATAAFSTDGGKTFQLAEKWPTAFRSAVVHSNGPLRLASNKDDPYPNLAGFYATGPTGTDYSSDGKRWVPLTEVGYHTMVVGKDGRIFAAGSAGRFGIAQ